MKTFEEILQAHYISDRGLVNPDYVKNAAFEWGKQVASAVRLECEQQTIRSIDPYEINQLIQGIDLNDFIK